MNKPEFGKDLVVLVACKDMKFTFEALLRRCESLGTRAFSFEIFPHPQHDPGVRIQSVPFLRSFQNNYHHALVVFDHEGSGSENTPAVAIEQQIANDLNRSGWQDRSCVLVLEPELETWVWSASPHVDRILGWGERIPPLRNWLVEQNFVSKPDEKPSRPKEAMKAAMSHSGKPRSSAVFRELAANVRFAECQDRSFVRFVNCLREWFPADL